MLLIKRQSAAIHRNANAIETIEKFGLPAYVFAVRVDQGAVILNVRNGTWHRLNESGLFTLELLCEGSVARAAAAIAEKHPQITPARIREDVLCCVKKMMDSGLLSRYPNAKHRVRFVTSKYSQAVPNGEMLVARKPLSKERVGALRGWSVLCAFFLMVVLKCTSFGVRVRITTFLHRFWCRQTASTSEGLKLLNSVHRVSRWFPGRIACLELSLTTVLAAALLRQEISWVIGAATDPYRFHAWTETDGAPLRLEGDEAVLGVYQPILRC